MLAAMQLFPEKGSVFAFGLRDTEIHEALRFTLLKSLMLRSNDTRVLMIASQYSSLSRLVSREMRLLLFCDFKKSAWEKCRVKKG